MSLKMSDAELLEELKSRFDANARTLRGQQALMEQLKSVNEKLLASERMKTDFLSNIRNEINNPVASILGLSRSITEGSADLATLKKFAALIHAEIFNLDFQLRNIFLSAEVEAGEAAPCVSGVQVASLAENVVRSFREQVAARNLTLAFRCDIPREEVFTTDPEKLHLVLSNLLSNAVRYNRDGGTIDVSCAIENTTLVIAVTDSGVGIPEEYHHKIFDRFWQLEIGPDKTYSGHGLGLSITKALVEILGGTIAMESENGKGCRFTVRLNPLEATGGDDDIFSADGNDFLFSDKLTF